MKKIDVHIHTNGSCNLRCNHCYVNCEPGNTTVLPANDIVPVIHFLLDNYSPDIHLEGGEVMLVPEVFKALSVFSPEELKAITITTNGTISVRESGFADLLTHVSKLRFSLEGHTDELNHAIRQSNVRQVLDNARYCQAVGISVTLRLTLNSHNYGVMVSDTLPFFFKEGFSDIEIYEHQAVGRGADAGQETLKSLSGFFADLLEYPPKGRIRICLPKKRGGELRLYTPDLEKAGAVVRETGGAKSVNIGCDGSIRICAWDNSSRPLGYLKEGEAETLKSIIDGIDDHNCEFCSAFVISFGGGHVKTDD